VTVLLHVLFGSALAYMDRGDDEPRRLRSDLDQAQVIEASLAFKSTEKKVTRQPQKPKAPKDAPQETIAVSRDAQAKPQPKPPDKPQPSELIDPTSVLRKNRAIDLSEPDLEAGEETPREGSAAGSEWGTADDARGDPYVGELHGRIKRVWNLPTLETQFGEALGCVRLNADGRITERTLSQKSGIPTLDRSVGEALRNATDMEQPVPPHLIGLLTRKGICFRFKLDG
jgi:outer membrane biosynthesis protein TonB